MDGLFRFHVALPFLFGGVALIGLAVTFLLIRLDEGNRVDDY